eukprot:GFUD01070144.1.p3 GENE.GFUD01070144.1~~GFUD01070144.1.p3  ORF type:complete len:101 (-),score=25.84 GFUD01070144.1:33-335(-)
MPGPLAGAQLYHHVQGVPPHLPTHHAGPPGNPGLPWCRHVWPGSLPRKVQTAFAGFGTMPVQCAHGRPSVAVLCEIDMAREVVEWGMGKPNWERVKHPRI